MIIPQSISEKLLFSTVRIQTRYKTGETGSGTGFIFTLIDDQAKNVSFIITNKHVVEDTDYGSFFVHESFFTNGVEIPSDNSVEVRIPSFPNSWCFHNNPDVDLCAFPFQSLIDESIKISRKIYFSSITSENILAEGKLLELSAMEDVIMVGYPIGLSDISHNLPLLRRGITSTHPGIDFDGKSSGVVDMAVFPGSSGSPIMIVNEGSFHDNKGESLVLSNRKIFLGVLTSGPTWNSEGEIKIVNIPTLQKVVAEIPIMINLGFYIKAKEVIHLCEQACKHFRY